MELTQLVAGDTLDFETAVPSYPAPDGWTLTYRLVPRSGAAIEFSSNATPSDPANYRMQVGASTTATWAAGAYGWASYVSKSGIRYTVAQGQITILPDPGVATNVDTRSHARKCLDAIEAVLEKRATQAQEEIEIDGQRLKRTPHAELIRMRSHYAQLVASEDARNRLAQGLPGGRRVQVRF